MPFEYVCISSLDHVLLLLDAVSFVCDMAFVVDVVHLVLLAVEVLQDAWVVTVVLHAGPELLKCQARRQSFFMLILLCSILSCLCFFFNWLIHDWYDACVFSSLSGVRYCSMGLFTFEFERGGACSDSLVLLRNSFIALRSSLIFL